VGFFGMLNYAAFLNFLHGMYSKVDNSLEVTAQEIIQFAVDEIRSRLYPGHGYLTGYLHDSYSGSYNRSRIGTVDIIIGTDVYYAPWVEFKWGGRCAHFLPAMEVVQAKFPEIMSKNINLALQLGDY